MPSDLRDLLEQAAPPAGDPDFAALARAGRRRRYSQRAASGLAVAVIIALTSAVVLPRLRPPSVLFDAGPRKGVGSWEAVPPSPIGARVNARVASDGERVVVFGGTAPAAQDGEQFPQDGAVFDVRMRGWTAIPAVPLADVSHLELLDDGRLLALQAAPVVAAFYDFEDRRWELTRGAPMPSREPEAVVWTGTQLLVWGGWNGARAFGDGAVWSAETGWREMADSPLRPRTAFSWTWTGDQMLVWGGAAGPQHRERVFADGASYDPKTDTWSAVASGPLRARQDADSIWTGEAWIVVGGYGATQPLESSAAPKVGVVEMSESCDGMTCEGSAGVSGGLPPEAKQREFHDAARYDPATNRWTRIAPAPRGRRLLAGVAYDRVISYGSRGYAEYVPGDDSWTRRGSPVVDANLSAWDAVAVGGRIVLLNSGPMVSMGDTDRPRRLRGVVYDDEHNLWDDLTEADTPQRHGAVVAVVAKHVFVWGGSSVTTDISRGFRGDPWRHHDDGALLTPD